MTPDLSHRETIRHSIHEGAALTPGYLLMNVLATIIATYGLFADSPAVVIGAMVVALLLVPIAGVALALVDGEAALLRRAFVAEVAGVGTVLGTALLLGLVHRDIPATHELLARTSPNFLDLGIALAGGAAGTYALVAPRLNLALVGVAIATALEPPLSTCRIFLARGESDLALGAFLLACTNIVAIQFASSVVLWATGFHRLTATSASTAAVVARNALSIVVLVGLAVFLGVNLKQSVAQMLFETSTRQVLAQAIQAYPGAYVAEVRFATAKRTTLVCAVVRGTQPLTSAQVGALEAKLPAPPDGSPRALQVRFVDIDVITPQGRLYEPSGKQP